MRWWRRLFGDPLPEDFPGELEASENALGSAAVAGGGHLVVTELGLWVPSEGRARRIGWHLVSKAVWGDGTLTVVEAEETGTAGAAVVLRDRDPVRFALARPGKVPWLVRQRVDGSIRARHRAELTSGGVWFVQRKLPGRDGVVLQARPDAGVDADVVAAIAREAAAKLAHPEA
ncbi:hypothetical protein GCM10027445_22680 [Amycolatopsis endophytica]|uniref:Uncharacterized protein n=1 Tax=Amycolatopsis endophytica TaxID=860233 RepID=A0A853BFU1_9PSEU|nr:hypothetical protein [Amycolatopsis endophytica]NYI93532.1 hypothetical protein [Amycolatopsis endophytica]